MCRRDGLFPYVDPRVIPRIQIPDEKKLINELEQFQYKISEVNQDRIMLHAPEGGHDDEVDSLALMAYGLTKSFGYIESEWISNKSDVKGQSEDFLSKGISLGNSFESLVARRGL